MLKDFTFIRFGGLNVKKQKGYSKDSDSYHSPPATRGIYAMPFIAQEYFLIGSIREFQKSIFSNKKEKINDLNYNKLILKKIRKKFIKNTGFIWHHLEKYTKENEIIKRNGSWIKTTILTWNKSFLKTLSTCKYEFQVIKNYSYFSKDFFEVFFEEKV